MKLQNQNPTSISHRGKLAAALCAIAISSIAWTVSAKDEVPFKAEWTGETIAVVQNPDGTRDQIGVNVGHGTHIGKATEVLEYRVDVPVYDPASNSLLIHLVGTFLATAANGDTVEGTFEAVETVPLDELFQPLPPPYISEATWEMTSGTGRFAGVTGHGTTVVLDHGDGTASQTDTGVISTVGSNKK